MTGSGELTRSSRIKGKPTLDALAAFFVDREDERFLAALSERDQRMVRLVVEGYSYASIAEELGVTKQRVSQVAKTAVRQLQRAREQAGRAAAGRRASGVG